MRYKHFGFIYPKANGGIKLRAELSRLKTIFLSRPLSFKEKLYWLQYNKEQELAYKKAINTFHEALMKGEETLNNTHEKYCGKPPIPLK